MASIQEMQHVDRELHSELIESPINPAYFHMCTPLVDGYDPLFYLHINGEALWQWRSLNMDSGRVFDIMQENLLQLGYRLTSSSRVRVGNILKRRVDYLLKKVRNATNGDIRRSFRSQFWAKVAINPDEILLGPEETIRELRLKENDMAEENKRLRKEVEDKATELYNAMALLKDVQAAEATQKGKKFIEVGLRQQQRRLKEIREKAEQALWFAETYGLIPKSLELEVGSGQQINLSLTCNSDITQAEVTPLEDGQEVNQLQPSSTDKPKETFERLSEDDKEKIRTLLYIMDRFSISLQGYHEMTQVDDSLPRTHLVESCVKVLDSRWDIKRTPGEPEGAELPLKLLLEREIRIHLKTMNGTLAGKPLKVKISGDGARMSHSSNLFVLTFAIIEDGQNFLSSAGNHTVAIVKANEDHNTLKASLANVIQDINGLIDNGQITVDGMKVDLEFYLGGDYKFLLIAMGMKGATSNNSCIWCTIYKKERCNMSHSCSYFLNPPLVRAISKNWHKQPGCHSQPFFNIQLENIVIDELHLMLRITDRLEEGLILDILKWDEDDNKDKPPRHRTEAHLSHLISTVHSLGVSLRVYHSGEKWEWTSLLGGEKRSLLRKLPEHFEKLLPASRVESTKSLWINFRELLDDLSTEKMDEEEINMFEVKVLNWGKQMVSVSGSGPGYMHTVIITPYMHILLFHVPVMLRRHGSLKIFSGQGVEKKNDDFRRYFHRKINRWDACTNLLLVEKRQEELRECERQKRSYIKRNTSFWVHGGKEATAKKVIRISTVRPATPETPDSPSSLHVQLSEHELKKKKVPELIALLQQQTGKQVTKRTRKKELIEALLRPALSRMS